MSKSETYRKLVGEVYNVFNKIWNIPKTGRHPGAILKVNSRYRSVIASKGTDEKYIRNLWKTYYIIIKPDKTNGLTKDTAFEKTPMPISVRKLQTNDRIGCMSKADLDRLREACFTPSKK
ncbi:MAG TPA: hypothetical protein ENK58_02925 [Desulfobacterales bacterium]|nr:hypothetical protein [Desulfobacterales bacterium]